PRRPDRGRAAARRRYLAALPTVPGPRPDRDGAVYAERQMRVAKGTAWVGTAALLVLVARWLANALAQPSPLANRFAGSTGGPSLVLVALVTLALAAAISVTVLWLAALGVRERQRLRPNRVPPRPRARSFAPGSSCCPAGRQRAHVSSR